MTRRIPITPTILVLAAAATMVALGVWQLGRKDEKEALIARYETALSNQEPLAEFPLNYASDPSLDYRPIAFDCDSVKGWRSIAGRNRSGQAGYVHVAQCALANVFRFDHGPGYDADLVVGWSRRPDEPTWHGGAVKGIVVPGGDRVVRVVADPPLAGLEPNAKPDPRDLPNNHLAYAGQWFFFALTALVIYWLALRRRWREQ